MISGPTGTEWRLGLRRRMPGHWRRAACRRQFRNGPGPSASSNQNSLMITFFESQAAGTLVNLSDSQGPPILTLAPSKAFQSLVISSPELVQGRGSTLSTGGSCEDGQNGYYGSGVYTGGTKLCQVTLSDTMTTISSDGTVLSGNMGGGFRAGRGNRGQRPANG